MMNAKTLLLKKLAFRLHYFFLRGKLDLVVSDEVSAALLALKPIVPGNPQEGEQMLLNRFTFYGESHDLAGVANLRPEQAGPYWLTEFHSFGWIRSLLTFNQSYIAASHLRDYLYRWVEHSSRLPTIARHPIVMGERIANWVRYSHVILDGASLLFARHFIRSLAQQAYALHESLEEKDGASGFAAIRGTLLASLLLPDADYMQKPALRVLENAIRLQVLPDGGHVSRSPSLHARQLEQLLKIRQLLLHMELPAPEALSDAIARMAGILKYWMHADGGLALFNDSIEEDSAWLAALLTHVALTVEPAQTPDSHFERLQSGQSRLLADVGVPQAGSSHSFPGTLSFEWSHGAERIIVNCGAYRGARNEWRKACKMTAAHSTLVLNDRNSFQAPSTLPPLIEVRRGGQTALEAYHNGYEEAYGIRHFRILAFYEDGTILKGADRLEQLREGAMDGLTVHVRFHLHPRAKPRRSGHSSWEIILPSGQVWDFQCSLKENIVIEDSVYLGHAGRPEKTHQLVIEWNLGLEKEWSMDWSFTQKRVTAPEL